MEHTPDMNSTVFTDITTYLDSRGRAEQCYGSTWGGHDCVLLENKRWQGFVLDA